MEFLQHCHKNHGSLHKREWRSFCVQQESQLGDSAPVPCDAATQQGICPQICCGYADLPQSLRTVLELLRRIIRQWPFDASAADLLALKNVCSIQSGQMPTNHALCARTCHAHTGGMSQLARWLREAHDPSLKRQSVEPLERKICGLA